MGEGFSGSGKVPGSHAKCAGAPDSPSQALPRQLSQRESQAVSLDAKVLGIIRKFPAVLLPLPLGEVASRSDDGEGARRSPHCKTLGAMRKFPAVLLALPLGELSPQVTERTQQG